MTVQWTTIPPLRILPAALHHHPHEILAMNARHLHSVRSSLTRPLPCQLPDSVLAQPLPSALAILTTATAATLTTWTSWRLLRYVARIESTDCSDCLSWHCLSTLLQMMHAPTSTRSLQHIIRLAHMFRSTKPVLGVFYQCRRAPSLRAEYLSRSSLRDCTTCFIALLASL